MKNKQLKNSLSLLVIFLIFIGGIHIMLLEYILPKVYTQPQVLYIYIFLGLFSFIGISAIFLIHKNDDTLIGKGFLVLTVFKILSSFVFLYPWLENQDEFTKPFVFQFFAIFFPILLFETLIILKVIMQSKRKKQ